MSRLAVSQERSLPRKSVSNQRRSEAITGYLMAAPWLIGFVLFIGGPMIASLYQSMTSWDLFSAPKWIGFGNYVTLFTNDEVFLQSLKVTSIYAFIGVPLQVGLGLVLATLLNQKIRLQSVFRTIFYLPSVIGGISIGIMFRWVFGTQFGLLNSMLSMIGIQGPSWLGDPNWVMTSFILMSLWGSGASMLVYLGALQSIPTELYEAAEVDGAGAIKKFFRITVPLVTPAIFLNMVMGIIESLQEFTLPLVMTNGGPANSSMFLVLYLYEHAFQFFKMGYASAIAWVLFIYVMILTLLIFRSSNAWVYYEGSMRGR